MSYEMQITETFDEELCEIELYLAEQSDQAALYVKKTIHKRLQPLKSTPYMYPIYPERPEFRMLVIFRYLIFYKVHEKKKIVEVRHIIHGMREVIKLLSD